MRFLIPIFIALLFFPPGTSAQNAVSGDRLLDLLGKRLNEPEVFIWMSQNLGDPSNAQNEYMRLLGSLRKGKPVERAFVTPSAITGIGFAVEKSRLQRLDFHALSVSGMKGFAPYQENLPGGIRLGTLRKKVEKAIGPGPYTFGNQIRMDLKYEHEMLTVVTLEITGYSIAEKAAADQNHLNQRIFPYEGDELIQILGRRSDEPGIKQVLNTQVENQRFFRYPDYGLICYENQNLGLYFWEEPTSAEIQKIRITKAFKGELPSGLYYRENDTTVYGGLPPAAVKNKLSDVIEEEAGSILGIYSSIVLHYRFGESEDSARFGLTISLPDSAEAEWVYYRSKGNKIPAAPANNEIAPSAEVISEKTLPVATADPVKPETEAEKKSENISEAGKTAESLPVPVEGSHTESVPEKAVATIENEEPAEKEVTLNPKDPTAETMVSRSEDRSKWETDPVQDLKGDCVLGDCLDGYAEMELSTGGQYEGLWSNGKPDGSGKFDDGYMTYQGGFAAGLFHGEGNLQTPAFSYRGRFNNGKFHGFGKKVLSDGRSERGNFVNGNLSQGSINLPDGREVSGTFIELKRGNGTISYPDGTQYEGDFLDLIPEGEGIMFLPNRDQLEGQFHNGKLNGIGKAYIAATGESQEGPFENGMRNGKFRVMLENGTRAEGTYTRDRKDGVWIWNFPDRRREEVRFQNGEVVEAGDPVGARP
jgi:hypothetical protein